MMNRYVPTSLAMFGSKGTLLQTLIGIDSLHVMLLGGAGTGKTTICNLILKEYYKGHVESANVLYINSVKEQGVQYYRTEVRIFCQTTSTVVGKRKTIVLDDMDVISEQGQQVFLTGLDNYGHMVNYIVTCSCQHNLIESIHSRLICVQLNTFSSDYMRQLLVSIAQNENVRITEEAQNMIILRCNSSVRTLINYVEKFKLLQEEITEEVVAQCCSTIQESYLGKLMQYVLDKNLKEGLKVVRAVSEDGYAVMDILDAFFTYLKLYSGIDDILKYKMTKIISKYICIFNQIHEHSVELLFFVNELIDVV